MPAFSGLQDGIHGQTYANVPKSDALPPTQRGIVRALMQGRGMHGHVTALGRNSPSVIAQIDAARATIAVPGTFTYATRVTARDVDLTNSSSTYSNETKARPTSATEGDMAHTYDTTLRNGHPADAAMTGVTSPAVTEVISDGT